MTDTPQGAWMREYERRRTAVVYAASNHGKTLASIYATEGDRGASRAALTAARTALDAHVRGLHAVGNEYANADALSAVHRTLAFFRSVIQSGESWSETCQREYDMALGVLDAASGEPSGAHDTFDEAAEQARLGFIPVSGAAPQEARE